MPIRKGRDAVRVVYDEAMLEVVRASNGSYTFGLFATEPRVVLSREQTMVLASALLTDLSSRRADNDCAGE